MESVLLGRHVAWAGSNGYQSGPVMAVYISREGRPMLLVLLNDRLVSKDAEGVQVKS